MKFAISKVLLFLQKSSIRRTARYFLKFLGIFVALFVMYSILFHYIMAYEGKEYSWVTGCYWTLTVMSTLGFGDIVFVSDIGRAFSIIVLVSGIVLLLVMLPFAFIQYGYSPWLEAQKKNSAPRAISHSIQDHIIVVGLSPIALNLTDHLTKYGFYCILLCPDIQTSLNLEDQGYNVVVGDYDDENTYRNLRVGDAAMIIALDSDKKNCNIIFSARAVDANVPIVAKADSQEIIALAGSSRPFMFRKLLGESLAGRVAGNMGSSSYLTGFASLTVTETNISNTNLAGKTLRECCLRAQVGVNIVGMWVKGKFVIPLADEPLPEDVTLVMAGTKEEFAAFDVMMSANRNTTPEKAPRVLVLGGGRVGIAAAQSVHRRNIDVVIVDKIPLKEVPKGVLFIHGDATDIDVLKQAGIETASTVIVTPHDDDINIYLTLYCRKLRPDVQILSRASLDRNVNTLHEAGANVVLSLASLMTNQIINMLIPGKVFMLRGGLSMFRCTVNRRIAGKSLHESKIRERTLCSVVGVRKKDGSIIANPLPTHVFNAGEEIYLVGDNKAQDVFVKCFGMKSL